MFAPNKPPNILTIGPSNAPKKPPRWTSFFFSLMGVFFSASFRSSPLCRLSCLLCVGVKATFPIRIFLQHSETHFTNSLLQFLLASVLLCFDDALCNARKYGANFLSLSDILRCQNIKSTEVYTRDLRLLFGHINVIVLVIGKNACFKSVIVIRARL